MTLGFRRSHHGAGALLDLGALSLQVLGKEDALGGVRQQLCEQALALGKPGPAQIEAFVIARCP